VSRRPSYTIHDGFRMPRGFPVEAFASALCYEAQPDDLFITTYPKCGTTWLQHIVYLMLHEGRPLAADRSMTIEIPHLEEVGREFVEAMPRPRCIKTHLPFALTPSHPRAKYLYVARNPFDCAVSFYHHTRGFPQHYDFEDGTFDDFFECFLAGEVDWGDYFDNLLSWWAHRDDGNLLFLTYEGMQADIEGAIATIGAFLGPPAESAVRDPAQRAAILRHSSFDAMRRDQGRWSSKRPDGMPPFIRKGQVGDWRNHFSAAQARRLAVKLAARTRGTGIERLWPDLPGADADQLLLG